MGSDHNVGGREARLSNHPGLWSMVSAMTRRLVIVVFAAAGMTVIAGAGGGPFAQTPPSERELRIYAGLHDAAARGDVAGIEQLIAEGEKPNIQDAKSRTPLHVATFMRKYDAARALLRHGANPNALDAERYDIVTIAAVNSDLEMLKIALEPHLDEMQHAPINDPARYRFY